MTALEVYAILKKKIETAATGIADIYKEGDYLIFVMADGSKFRVEDATKDIIGVSIDENNYIVITYVDGTTTTSDDPIPQPNIMQGATSLLDGEAGLVPKPLSGDIGYLNSRGEWDTSLTEKVETLEETIPTDDIPEGATLTADGWTITNDNEVSNEFAKWEG